MNNHLFCFGFGYTAGHLARRLASSGDWQISGTATTPAGRDQILADGYSGYLFAGDDYDPLIEAALATATHIVMSAPPGDQGDPALSVYAAPMGNSPAEWIGYLSTVGVYGDRQGDWVDEDTAPKPGSARTARRVAAEQQWLALGQSTSKRAEIFRLSGIYGPGRSAIDSVRDGSARRVIKPGQVFNRIHVEDIAATLAAAVDRATGHAIFNVTDDEPAPPQDVISYAAGLVGLPVPPDVAYEHATMSPMGRSFYEENRRVRNDRIKSALGVQLRFPTYREGLSALAQIPP